MIQQALQLQLQRPPPVGMSFGPALYGNASGLFYIGYSVFQIPSKQPTPLLQLQHSGGRLHDTVGVGCCHM